MPHHQGSLFRPIYLFDYNTIGGDYRGFSGWIHQYHSVQINRTSIYRGFDQNVYDRRSQVVVLLDDMRYLGPLLTAPFFEGFNHRDALEG